MSVDSVTASLILSAASKSGSDHSALWDSVKEVVTKEQGGPSPEAVAFFEANKGKAVKVLGTSYIAELTGLNTSTRGFYPGSLCPLFVKITASDDPRYEYAVGETFEYSLEQISLL